MEGQGCYTSNECMLIDYFTTMSYFQLWSCCISQLVSLVLQLLPIRLSTPPHHPTGHSGHTGRVEHQPAGQASPTGSVHLVGHSGNTGNYTNHPAAQSGDTGKLYYQVADQPSPTGRVHH